MSQQESTTPGAVPPTISLDTTIPEQDREETRGSLEALQPPGGIPGLHSEHWTFYEYQNRRGRSVMLVLADFDAIRQDAEVWEPPPDGRQMLCMLFSSNFTEDPARDARMRSIGLAISRIPDLVRSLRRYALSDECDCIVDEGNEQQVLCAFCEASRLIFSLTGEQV